MPYGSTSVPTGRQGGVADRSFGPYPGLAIVGGGRISGLYGVNGGLVDAQGTGLQHCFLGDYRHDLIHTATTLIRLPDRRLLYGNRSDDGLGHPQRMRPARVFNRDGYAWGSTFAQHLRRTEVVTASAPGVISFACTVEGPFTGDVMAFVVFRPWAGAACRRLDDGRLEWEGPEGKRLVVTVEEGTDLYALTADSPSGFLYRTVQSLQDASAHPACGRLESDQPIGLGLGRHIRLAEGDSCTFRWHLGGVGEEPGDPGAFWEAWYAQGRPAPALELPEADGLDPAVVPQWYRANLAAIRGAEMNGFVPADMTGQYYAQGRPSYYARDAQMIARAFLASGHLREAGAIIRYLADRPLKRGGEFCQRYSAEGSPSEGQHNGVPHQLDSQGYFVRNVVEYFRQTGEWLVAFDRIAAALDVLADCLGPQSLCGPEGGVNEGVYGSAYIISSNMFIYGGLIAGMEAARTLGQAEAEVRWERLAAQLWAGIESCWDEGNGRYWYGYVTYDEHPVRQYDTPQYFGPLSGYPITERMRRNDRFLRRYASFYGFGIGYSEQEYHHGPWIFNTAACAQFQALVGQQVEYNAILRWLMTHSNQYGLMPEAVDGDDESICHVNPLVWGCAETVAAIAIRTNTGGRLPWMI